MSSGVPVEGERVFEDCEDSTLKIHPAKGPCVSVTYPTDWIVQARLVKLDIIYTSEDI